MANSTFSNCTSNHSQRKTGNLKFSPKKETLNKIMAYSRALEMKNSKHLPEVEIVLN